MGQVRNACKILVGRPEAKRLFRAARCRWESSIETGFKETGCEGVNWIHVPSDSVK
jgi:hypothetical protein